MYLSNSMYGRQQSFGMDTRSFGQEARNNNSVQRASSEATAASASQAASGIFLIPLLVTFVIVGLIVAVIVMFLNLGRSILSIVSDLAD
jgi:hypothetical protein